MSLAVLHGVAGYLAFGISTHEDIQEAAFYVGRNPLAGDFTKFLVVSSNCTLVACGLLAFIVPLFAVIAVWTSAALALLAALFGAATRVADQRFPGPLIASVAVRFIAAGALTIAFGRGWTG